MTLPLLVSVPHGGSEIPQEVESLNLLTPRQIREDGDEGAAEIYDIAMEVRRYVSTSIARAFVDMNRAETDRSKDGVVKTHTCLDVPIYEEPLAEDIVRILLDRYHRPYHRMLSSAAGKVVLGIDCHTMAEIGPPVGPDAGSVRPLICLSNADGTCPDEWFDSLIRCLSDAFETEPAGNRPFRGGFIIRSHAHELPWVQLELSRSANLSFKQKRIRVVSALDAWCRIHA